MASDEIIWGIVDKQFCSYKLKAPSGQSFCHNEYNVTGFCSRQACPLANSRYATVRANPETGRLYLYMKTVERAHLPSKLWERIRLSQNYAEALEQIDSRLIYWPKFLVHKCKQRLTRLTQVAIRMRRIAREEERLGERLVAKRAPKIRHREKTRERKAEAAAQLEKTIERQLLERLRSGTYGHEPLNVSEAIWKKVLVAMEREDGATRDKDMDRGIEAEQAEAEAEAESDEELESEMEDENEDEEEHETVKAGQDSGKARQALAVENDAGDDLAGNVEYVSDFDESEDEVGDIEDWLGENAGKYDDDDDDSELTGEEDDDEESDEEDDEDEDEDDLRKKRKAKMAGDKRKRGRVIRMKPAKKTATKEKVRMMVEYANTNHKVASAEKSLAF